MSVVAAGSTADHGETAVERFLARQRRKIVHARFRGGEVVSPSEYGGETLNQYLGSGPTSRFFSRAFALFLAVVLIVGPVAGLGVLISGAVSGWMTVVVVAFAVLTGYYGLQFQAGWRCMRRHRKSPRRGR